MIIEGLLTTTDEHGAPHVAPMGPVVNAELTSWQLRPFQTSTTFQLLRANANCVFHIVDDVLPVVQAALGFPVETEFELQPTGVWTIPSACHWYHLRVQQWNVEQARAEAEAQVIHQSVQRPFWGWNRAKHAVLEATILATRLHIVSHQSIRSEMERLEVAVAKTGGPRETTAWQLVQDYICGRLVSGD
jgi:hypothetical protein